MADLKITQLDAAGELLDADLMEVVQNVASSPANKKVSLSDLATYFGGGGAGASGFVYAYMSSGGSLTHNTLATVEYDTVEFDPDSLWDGTTNYNYTCPEDGFYFVYAALRILNFSWEDGWFRLRIIASAGRSPQTEYAAVGASNPEDGTICTSGILQLSENDTIEIGAEWEASSGSSGKSTLASSNGSFVNIYKIG